MEFISRHVTSLAMLIGALNHICFFHSALSREYCQFDTFNATCPNSNQVIVIDEARYGRLQLGRCVTRDYGYIGCSANVIDLMDRACSGRRSCRVSVPAMRDLVQPCPKDLTSYLDVNYRCITVFNTSNRCNSTVQLNETNPSLYLLTSSSIIPSAIDRLSASPSPVCPVTITVSPGQRIAFTLYSFRSAVGSDQSPPAAHQSPTPANRGSDMPLAQSSSSSGSAGSSSSSSGQTCAVSGTLMIVDGGSGRRRSISFCDVRQSREQNLLTTNGSSASVFFSGNGGSPGVEQSAAGGGGLTSSTQRRQQQQQATGPDAVPPGFGVASSSSRGRNIYVIKLEATGCADIEPPRNARVERYDDSLVVKCNLSQETWYLTCKGTSWIGTVTNCSDAGILPYNEEIGSSIVHKKKHVPFGLWMAVTIGIGLGIVFGFVMLIGVFIYRRCKAMRAPPKHNVLLSPCDETLMTDTSASAVSGGTATISASSYPSNHMAEDYYISCSGYGNRRNCTSGSAAGPPLPQPTLHSFYSDSAADLGGSADHRGGRTTFLVGPLPPPTITADWPDMEPSSTFYRRLPNSMLSAAGTGADNTILSGVSVEDPAILMEHDGLDELADRLYRIQTHGSCQRGQGQGQGRSLPQPINDSSVYRSLVVRAPSSTTSARNGDSSTIQRGADVNQVKLIGQGSSCGGGLPEDSGPQVNNSNADQQCRLPQSFEVCSGSSLPSDQTPSTPRCFVVGDSCVRFAGVGETGLSRMDETLEKTSCSSVTFGGRAEGAERQQQQREDERPDLVRNGRAISQVPPPPPPTSVGNSMMTSSTAAGEALLIPHNSSNLRVQGDQPPHHRQHHQLCQNQSSQHYHHHQQQQQPPMQRQTSDTLTAPGVTFRDWRDSPVLNI